MQHSNVVRGGHGLGNVNQQLQPGFERNLGEASLHVGPFRQVRSGILALQKERRRLKIPFQDADELRPVAQRFAQET